AGIAGVLVWIKHPRKLRTLAWSAAIVVAIMGPFAVRNHAYMRLWSPIGSGQMNGLYAASGKKNIEIGFDREGARWHYTFSSPSFYAQQFLPLSDWQPKRSGEVNVSIDLRKGSADWERESARTAVHGVESLRLRWENVLLVMFGVSWPDNNAAY